MLRYLFVCSAGEKRSPTAASVARELSEERGIQLLAVYGGIDVRLMLPKKKMREHFKQYDLIFAMENYMVDRLEEKCGVDRSKIALLNIPDNYERHDPVLRNILKKKLNRYIK